MIDRKRSALPTALCIPGLKAEVLRVMLDKVHVFGADSICLECMVNFPASKPYRKANILFVFKQALP